MRKIALLLAAVLLVTAVPAFAGSGEKCTENTQTCLNHWAKNKDKGWLGLKYDKNATGDIAVTSIMPGSPAASAGFEVGDILVALNGAKMADKDAVKKAKGEWKVGQAVTYTVKRGTEEKQIAATLAQMPDEVFASMLGQHMLENHVAMATAEAGTYGEAKATKK